VWKIYTIYTNRNFEAIEGKKEGAEKDEHREGCLPACPR
jgi:hypothetical protein